MAIIDINQTWYDANLPAEGTYFPVLMTGAGNTYRLIGNITANGSGLIFGANDQTLNLNGFTLTYDNQASVTVPNGDFETGTPGNPPPNWDTSQAPGFQIAVNGTSSSPFLWGSQVGMFITPANHIIKSSTITIPSVYQGVTLAAMVTDQGGSDAATTLRVKDAVTNATIVEATEAGNAQLSVVAGFNPTAAIISNGVYLEVQCNQPSFNTPIDRVVIRPYGSSGVFCIRSPWGLPSYLQVPYINAAVVNRGTILGPGSIVQGNGKAVQSIAVNTAGQQDMLFDGVTFSMVGDDPIAIGSFFTGYFFTIKNCTFNFPGGSAAGRPDYNITHRGVLYAAIKFDGGGTLNIENNAINNHPQNGIVIANSGTFLSKALITGNTINLNTYHTNGWGILLNSTSGTNGNMQIANNMITAAVGKSSRGIMIDALGTAIYDGIEINNNTIDVRERGNREFTTSGLECQAMKMRVTSVGSIRNLNVHDNTFASTTDDTLVHAATGLGFGFETGAGCTGIVFANNVFRATVTGTNATYWARAISFRHHNQLIVSTNDTFESNDCSINFHDNDGFGLVDGVTFINPSLVKNAATPPSGVVYHSYDIGFSEQDLSTTSIKNIRVYSPNYVGGATATVFWFGSGNPKDIAFGHLVTVNVQDGLAAPVQNATVTWKDNELTTTTDTGVTPASGQLANMKVTEFVHQQLTTNPASITIDNEKPQRLEITHIDFTPYSEDINITVDQSITRQLAGGPVPPPVVLQDLVCVLN